MLVSHTRNHRRVVLSWSVLGRVPLTYLKTIFDSSPTSQLSMWSSRWHLMSYNQCAISTNVTKSLLLAITCQNLEVWLRTTNRRISIHDASGLMTGLSMHLLLPTLPVPLIFHLTSVAVHLFPGTLCMWTCLSLVSVDSDSCTPSLFEGISFSNHRWNFAAFSHTHQHVTYIPCHSVSLHPAFYHAWLIPVDVFGWRNMISSYEDENGCFAWNFNGLMHEFPISCPFVLEYWYPCSHHCTNLKHLQNWLTYIFQSELDVEVMSPAGLLYDPPRDVQFRSSYANKCCWCRWLNANHVQGMPLDGAVACSYPMQVQSYLHLPPRFEVNFVVPCETFVCGTFACWKGKLHSMQIGTEAVDWWYVLVRALVSVRMLVIETWKVKMDWNQYLKLLLSLAYFGEPVLLLLLDSTVDGLSCHRNDRKEVVTTKSIDCTEESGVRLQEFSQGAFTVMKHSECSVSTQA